MLRQLPKLETNNMNTIGGTNAISVKKKNQMVESQSPRLNLLGIRAKKEGSGGGWVGGQGV